MRHGVYLLIVIAVGLMMVPSTSAQPQGGPEIRVPEGRVEPRSPEDRPWLVEQFDRDGDGTLNDQERQAARAARGARRGRPPRANTPPVYAQMREGGPEGPDGERGFGPRDERGFRPEGDRGRPGLDGRPRPDGPPLRNLEPLFAWFDNNSDAQLDRQEFGELSRFVRRQEFRPDRPPMGPRPDQAPTELDRRPEPGPGAGPRRGGRGRRGPGFGGPPGPGDERGFRRGRPRDGEAGEGRGRDGEVNEIRGEAGGAPGLSGEADSSTATQSSSEPSADTPTPATADTPPATVEATPEPTADNVD